MPDWQTEIRVRLTGLNISPARELEIIEELSHHLQDAYEKELSRGATEEDAERGALEELNASESLARELKQVERRVPQNPVVMGTDTKTSIIGDVTQDLRWLSLSAILDRLGKRPNSSQLPDGWDVRECR